jgi:UDP-N-acetylmuramoyl-tripeptide--D-alanyl-D-alanine ligase
MNIAISEIARATGGRILHGASGDAKATGISVDSRTLKPGALFVPIVGDNFDGHDYLAQAQAGGAVAAFTSRAAATADIPLILVADTRRALLDLAGHYRRTAGVKVVAVTGSAGKTTTKDMMACIFSRAYRTKKTIKNYNNDIGMPLSVFTLEPGDEYIILEMGMNHAGEIRGLSMAGAPDIAIITHIGDAHIENFENRTGILHAKLEIVEGLAPGGTVILNGDDPLLTGDIAREKTDGMRVLYPSRENILSTAPDGLNGTRCVFTWGGAEVAVHVPLPGAHMVMNALLATVAALESGVPPQEISTAFDEFEPAEGRLRVLHTRGMTVINDVYNASPASVQAAIDVLAAEEGRRVAVLGDMAELGNTAAMHHREAGSHAAKAGVDVLVAIGPHSLDMFEAFCAAAPRRTAMHFFTVPSFMAEMDALFAEGDIVLVKAANSMKFDQIIGGLEK